MSEIIDCNTKISVYELYKNGNSLFNDFYEDIKSNAIYFKSTTSAIKIIEQSANGLRLHKQKFRELKGTGLNCKVYEAKKDSVRIYMFQDSLGRVIVTGGVKGDQTKDIARIIKIIKDYQNE